MSVSNGWCNIALGTHNVFANLYAQGCLKLWFCDLVIVAVDIVVAVVIVVVIVVDCFLLFYFIYSLQ